MFKIGYTSPSSSAAAATHSVHVTVDLHCSSIATPDPVVVRRAACGECTAGGYRTGLGLSRTTESWYNGVAYRVLNVLVNLISWCFCRRADGLLIVDHSGSDGCREGNVVSLAGRGSGKRD